MLPALTFSNLMGGLIFGSIGFVAFIYGKRMNVWRPMFLGIALMVFPYFIENTTWLFATGIFGTALLFLFRNEKRDTVKIPARLFRVDFIHAFQ